MNRFLGPPWLRDRLEDEAMRGEVLARYLVAFRKSSYVISDNEDKATTFNRFFCSFFTTEPPLRILHEKRLQPTTDTAAPYFHVKGKLDNFGEFGGAKELLIDARHDAFDCIFFRLGRVSEFIESTWKFQMSNEDDKDLEQFLNFAMPDITRIKTPETPDEVQTEYQYSIHVVDCRQFEGTGSSLESARSMALKDLRAFVAEVKKKIIGYEDFYDGYNDKFVTDLRDLQECTAVALYIRSQ